jgi:hypothetical protein
MQTTLRINDETYRRAKAKSGELGLSLTRFFEEAVEDRLAKLELGPAQRVELPVSSVSGTTVSSAELERRMEAVQLQEDLELSK